MGRFADTRRFGQGTNTPAHFTWHDSPTSGEQNKKTRSFNFNVHCQIWPTVNVILAVVSFQMAKRQVYRLFPRHLLCQILLTRAQGTCLEESYGNNHSKNVLCSNGNTLYAKNDVLVFLVLPFEHKTFLAGPFLYDSPKHIPWARVIRIWHNKCRGKSL